VSAGRRPSFDELSSDAFELWAQHYERFDNLGMAKRMRSMRKVFNGLIDEGLPGIERWSRLSEQLFRVDKWRLCQG
jgi:hypothetical protein